jgi:Uma2 family endonuclease
MSICEGARPSAVARREKFDYGKGDGRRNPMMPTQVSAPLLTLDEYAKLPCDGTETELVRGKVVRMPPTFPYHGLICSRLVRILGAFAEEHGLGWVLSNDAGVVTERDPDTLRGPDVAFYSYARIPKGPFPQNAYLSVVPELVVEVRSPSDRWPKVLAKMAEYLDAGVSVVCILDAESQKVQLYRDALPQTLHGSDDLTVPDILPGFRVSVSRFFE